jgi:hypothetical protein
MSSAEHTNGRADRAPDRTNNETDGGAAGERVNRPLEQALRVRRRADLVTGLRGLASPRRATVGRPAGSAPTARPVAPGAGPVASTAPRASAAGSAEQERCELCGTSVPADHRHLLNLVERRIECSCESCWALRSGEAEYRPTGSRTIWLGDLELPDDVWAGFQIPIGLAFFMQSSTAGCVVALYPSPAGATESELHFSSWNRLVELNPVLGELEADVEGLIVNRLTDPPEYVIAPIDRCYALTGTIKASWEGISGGTGVTGAVTGFFAALRAESLAA